MTQVGTYTFDESSTGCELRKEGTNKKQTEKSKIQEFYLRQRKKEGTNNKQSERIIIGLQEFYLRQRIVVKVV